MSMNMKNVSRGDVTQIYRQNIFVPKTNSFIPQNFVYTRSFLSGDINKQGTHE